jgi:2-dehydropantoate 2-reductase
MRILVVGVGAIGGYFGGRLLAAQRDVTFLVRAHSAARLAAAGLEIQSPHGDLHLVAPSAILAEGIRSPFDLILLSCKAQDLPAAMESFAPAVGTATTILPLLNGMRHLPMLDEQFGPKHVVGGTCIISAKRLPDGRIVHLNALDRLVFGERDGARSERIDQVASTLADAGFESHLSEAILYQMWNKWIFIATAAGIACLMRAPIGDIVTAGAAHLTLRLLDECAAVAAGEGFSLSRDSLRRTAETLTAAGSSLVPSMLNDIENHAPTEAEQIVGDLLNRGRKHQLASPLLEIVQAHLSTYEARRSREGQKGASAT